MKGLVVTLASSPFAFPTTRKVPTVIATYATMKRTLDDIKADIDILSGETVGPTDSTWQDVAGTCAVNLRHLATLLDLARESKAESFISFPAWPTLGE